MKIGGVEVQGPSEQVLVLPRPLGEDIVIRCQAVADMSPFEAMCPEPKAKAILVAGGFKPNEEDPDYLEQVKNREEMRLDYLCLKSMEPSDIEWEKVKMGEPQTWSVWKEELKTCGLAEIEINRIIICVMQANCLDEDKLIEARKIFLLGMEEAAQKSSGQPTEPQSS